MCTRPAKEIDAGLEPLPGGDDPRRCVVIVGPDTHLGGLSSGGLGFTDTGNKAVIGGVSREFYQRIWQHYDRPDAWKWHTRE